jgi:hypothetical protein
MKLDRSCAVIFLLCLGAGAWGKECNKTALELVETLQNQSGSDTKGKVTLASALGDLQDLHGRYSKLGLQADPKECVDPNFQLDCDLFRRFKKSEIYETEASPKGRTSGYMWAGDIRQRLRLVAKALVRLRAPGGKTAEQRQADLSELQNEFSFSPKNEFFVAFKKAYLNDKNDGLDVIRAIRDRLRPPPDPEAPNQPAEEGICFEIGQSKEALEGEAKQLENSYLNPKSEVGQKMFGKNMKAFQTQAVQALKSVVSEAVEPTGRLMKACENIRDEVFLCLLNKEKNLSHDPQVLKALESFELPILKAGLPGKAPSEVPAGKSGAN